MPGFRWLWCCLMIQMLRTLEVTKPLSLMAAFGTASPARADEVAAKSLVKVISGYMAASERQIVFPVSATPEAFSLRPVSVKAGRSQ
jgi:hypothetical protein